MNITPTTFRQTFLLVLAIASSTPLLLGCGSVGVNPLGLLGWGAGSHSGYSTTQVSGPLQVTLTPSAWEVSPGTTVTVVANVAGGTPPYTHWWWKDGDGKWTQGTATYTGVFDQPDAQSLHYVVIDAAGVESDAVSVDIKVYGTGGQVCPSIAGTWSVTTGFGQMELQVTGGTFTGTYAGGCGRITGTLNGLTMTGTWDQRQNTCGMEATSGPFEWHLASDLSRFTGRWAYAGEQVWRPEIVDGHHTECEQTATGGTAPLGGIVKPINERG